MLSKLVSIKAKVKADKIYFKPKNVLKAYLSYIGHKNFEAENRGMQKAPGRSCQTHWIHFSNKIIGTLAKNDTRGICFLLSCEKELNFSWVSFTWSWLIIMFKEWGVHKTQPRGMMMMTVRYANPDTFSCLFFFSGSKVSVPRFSIQTTSWVHLLNSFGSHWGICVPNTWSVKCLYLSVHCFNPHPGSQQ